MSSHFLAFDIETIPRLDLPASCLPTFDPESVNIPANWGDEARQRKIDAERAKFDAGLSRKLGTQPHFCRPCCAVFYNSMTDDFLELYAKDPLEETALIHCAWKEIKEAFDAKIPLVSFNGKTFDLQVLWYRAMTLDVAGVDRAMYDRLTDMRTSNWSHIDLELSLGIRSPFSSRPEVKSFEYWLAYFGLGAKPEGMDGSKVWPMFQEGWHEDIQAYCRADVELLVALYRRVQAWVIGRTGDTKSWIDPSKHDDQAKAA